MTGRLQVALAAAVAVAALLLFSPLFAQVPAGPPLPTSWVERHAFLDDDLRSAAVDPLDSSRLYLGSEEGVLLSEDSGHNWRELNNFYGNRVTVRTDDGEDVMSAVRFFAGVFELEEMVARWADLEDIEFQPDAPEVEVTEVEAPIDLTEQLEIVRAELAAAEAAEDDVIARFEAWQPDDLTIAEVDGLPFDEGTDWLDQPYYGILEDWLSERGLPIAESALERREVLLDYLREQEAEGAALEAEVTSAQAAVEAAREQVAELEAQIDAAMEVVVEVEEEEPDVVPPDDEVEVEVEEEVEVGGVSAVSVDPANPSNIFAATLEGLFRSTDRGDTWAEIYSSPVRLENAFLSLTLDPSNPDTLFAGTLSGLALSRDGGDSWVRPSGAIADLVINTVAVHPFESDIVLAGTQSEGVLRSDDGGRSWRLMQLGSSAAENSIHTLVFSLVDPNRVYAGTEDGAYSSTNAGVSWTSMPLPGVPDRVVRKICVCPIDPDRYFILSDNALYGTRDGGRMWRRLTFGAAFRNLRSLAIDPMNPEVAWLVAAERIFLSRELPRHDLSDARTVSISGSGEFTLDGTTIHTLAIEAVDEDEGKVTIEVNSNPQRLDLKLGETARLDISGDGHEDVEVTLEDILDGTPVFRIEKLEVPDRPTLRLRAPDEITDLRDLDDYFLAEPTWAEVQDVAGRWAEVHPERIEAWRRGASLRALLPRVRLGYTIDIRDTYRERTDNWLRTDTDFRHDWELRTWDETRSTDRFRFWHDGAFTEWTRDYDLHRSDQSWETYEGWRVRDWNRYQIEEFPRKGVYTRLRLDWSLSELLWHRNQQYISTEVRRNLVPHRKSVLEEVTLYYFDRRSLRIDMILNPPADPFTRMEMLIRLQELDARIDAFTGGYFTRTIKERERKYPELQNYTFSGTHRR